jgi:hypothetical protein
MSGPVGGHRVLSRPSLMNAVFLALMNSLCSPSQGSITGIEPMLEHENGAIASPS